MGDGVFLAAGIFLLTYLLIITEKIHRTIVAMLGAALMVVLGIVSQHAAVEHIDFNTIGLLVGMMMIVSVTAETGLFKFIAIWSAQKVKGRPLALLVVLGLITAIGSAFLDNVTTVLLMVPVTFSITRELNIVPVPFLLTEILMSNIGGTATMIGDPPNIMIGSAVKDLSFIDFIIHLGPIVLVIVIVVMALMTLIYRKQLHVEEGARKRLAELDARAELTDIQLLIKAVAVLLLTITGFFLHQTLHVESATVALTGAFLLLLLTGEGRIERALAHVEWPTIFFFIGLFVLISGLVETGIIEKLAKVSLEFTGGSTLAASFLVLWMSALASAFVDNIPFVATMIPLIQDMGKMGIDHLGPVWWSLALGACLGGNGALVGASANLIVAGLAGKEGYPISFFRFMLIGFPVMIISVVLSTGYLYLRYFI